MSDQTSSVTQSPSFFRYIGVFFAAVIQYCFKLYISLIYLHHSKVFFSYLCSKRSIYVSYQTLDWFKMSMNCCLSTGTWVLQAGCDGNKRKPRCSVVLQFCTQSTFYWQAFIYIYKSYFFVKKSPNTAVLYIKIK